MVAALAGEVAVGVVEQREERCGRLAVQRSHQLPRPRRADTSGELAVRHRGVHVHLTPGATPDGVRATAGTTPSRSRSQRCCAEQPTRRATSTRATRRGGLR